MSLTDVQIFFSQVGFISGICIPCYELLSRLIPSTAPFLDGCNRNLDTWRGIAASRAKQEDDGEETGERGDG